MTDKSLSIAVLLAALAFAIAPFFTSFNGFGPDAFPIPQVDPQAQPAGYAFSIWGVIYLWLIVSAVFGVLRHANNPAWRKARLPLLVSLIVGAVWLPVAETSPLAATVLIWTMLGTALVALSRAPDDNRWVFKGAIGLYAGWLAAASWVSIALVGAGFGILFDGPTWAIIIVVAATCLSAAVLLRLHAIPEFGVAVVWALVAVVAKNGLTAPSAWLAALGAVLVTVLTVRHFLQLSRQA